MTDQYLDSLLQKGRDSILLADSMLQLLEERFRGERNKLSDQQCELLDRKITEMKERIRAALLRNARHDEMIFVTPGPSPQELKAQLEREKESKILLESKQAELDAELELYRESHERDLESYERKKREISTYLDGIDEALSSFAFETFNADEPVEDEEELDCALPEDEVPNIVVQNCDSPIGDEQTVRTVNYPKIAPVSLISSNLNVPKGRIEGDSFESGISMGSEGERADSHREIPQEIAPV